MLTTRWAVGLFVAAVVLCGASCSGGSASRSSTGTTTADGYVPSTHLDAGLSVLPLTMPDGETLTLRYPPQMRIAQLGFRSSLTLSLPIRLPRCCSRGVAVAHTAIARPTSATQQIAVYRGADGEPVRFFRVPPTGGPDITTYNLDFRFGPWLAQVDDSGLRASEARMNDSERRNFARLLEGRINADGFLVLHPIAPLRFGKDLHAEFASASSENNLELGTVPACPARTSGKRTRFVQGDDTPGVEWCDGVLRVVATGTSSFVDLADRELQVSPLTPVR